MALEDKKNNITYENCRLIIGQEAYFTSDIKEAIAELEKKISFSHGEIYYGNILRWMDEVFGKSLMPKGEEDDK